MSFRHGGKSYRIVGFYTKDNKVRPRTARTSRIQAQVPKRPSATQRAAAAKPFELSLHYYTDPSHGWIKISRKQLEELGIADKVSSQRNPGTQVDSDRSQQ